MREKKNIDRIYQENFKDFEREPGDKVWDNISARLDKKDKKKPLIIPLWLKLGGVAAILAIIVSSLVFTDIIGTPAVNTEIANEPSDSEKSAIPNTQKNSKNNSDTNSEGIVFDKNDGEKEIRNSDNNNYSPTITSQEKNDIPNSKSKVENSGRKDSPEKNTSIASTEKFKTSSTLPENNSRNKLNGINSTENTVAIGQIDEITIDGLETGSLLKEENALAEIEKEKNRAEESIILDDPIEKKMRLSTFAAPVFYKNIGGGNELSDQFSNNSSNSEVTFSYGLKVAYQISEKFRLRTGISKIDVNNTIQDISYSPAAIAANIENIRPAEDNIEIRFNNPSESGLPIGEAERNNAISASVFTPGEINQQFGFIEVPLELEFVLIDKKFGINLIGGGSGLFLDTNRVDLISGENKTKLGEANNINSTSFSTNIGLGMNYQLGNNFSLSVEPIFKYQLNTFKNVQNVQPINFGIYSGVNFRF